MELEREQIRLFLLFQFKLGVENATEAARQICNAFNVGVIKDRTAQDWFTKFRNGEENLSDKPRSGLPIEVNRQKVINDNSNAC
jgi:transposase